VQTKRINGELYYFWKRGVRWHHCKLALPQNRETICHERLKLPSGIEPTSTWSKDNGQYVVGVG